MTLWCLLWHYGTRDLLVFDRHGYRVLHVCDWCGRPKAWRKGAR